MYTAADPPSPLHTVCMLVKIMTFVTDPLLQLVIMYSCVLLKGQISVHVVGYDSSNTMVPALRNPSDERPPPLRDHICCDTTTIFPMLLYLH